MLFQVLYISIHKPIHVKAECKFFSFKNLIKFQNPYVSQVLKEKTFSCSNLSPKWHKYCLSCRFRGTMSNKTACNVFLTQMNCLILIDWLWSKTSIAIVITLATLSNKGLTHFFPFNSCLLLTMISDSTSVSFLIYIAFLSSSWKNVTVTWLTLQSSSHCLHWKLK